MSELNTLDLKNAFRVITAYKDRKTYASIFERNAKYRLVEKRIVVQTEISRAFDLLERAIVDDSWIAYHP